MTNNSQVGMVVSVGKSGITDGIIEQIKEFLDDDKSVTVKFQKSSLSYASKDEMAEHLSRALNVKGKVIGNTFKIILK